MALLGQTGSQTSQLTQVSRIFRDIGRVYTLGADVAPQEDATCRSAPCARPPRSSVITPQVCRAQGALLQKAGICVRGRKNEARGAFAPQASVSPGTARLT